MSEVLSCIEYVGDKLLDYNGNPPKTGMIIAALSGGPLFIERREK